MKKLLALWAIWLGIGTQLSGQYVQPIQGEVIVRFASENVARQVLQSLNAPRAAAVPSIFMPLDVAHHIYLLSFSSDANVQDWLQKIQTAPGVIAAQLNYEITPRRIPNDPEFEKQWGLERIGALDVWHSSTGGVTANGDTIVVAVLDIGFEISHADLQENIWRNRGEIPNDGIDNDANGYVDDVNGWNFNRNNKEHPRDAHGTAVAGIIGARGNNRLGVTGVNWQVKLMPLTISRVSDIIAAYGYVIEQRKRYNQSNGERGAFVVATNFSLGVDRVFCQDQPVWGGMYDLLGEVGILTGAAAANSSVDVDKVGDMPTTCPSEFLITSLNLTPENRIASNSAFGIQSIDLGAPGNGSFTTALSDRYSTFGDNSAAAPHVTGAIALLYSLPCAALTAQALTQPAQMALNIRKAILEGVEPLVSLQGKTATGGRLNVFRSMELLQNQCQSTVGELALLKIYPNPVSDQLWIEYETPDFESCEALVYNALGQIVWQESFTPPRFFDKKLSMNVRGWPPGLYCLVLQKGTDRRQMKFVVAR